MASTKSWRHPAVPSQDGGSDMSSPLASFSLSNWSQPQRRWTQARPVGTPSLGSSPDTEALLCLHLRMEHGEKKPLGHGRDPLKLMGLNHPRANHRLQKNYTRDEYGAVIFPLSAFQKDDLLSRLLRSAYALLSQSL